MRNAFEVIAETLSMSGRIARQSGRGEGEAMKHTHDWKIGRQNVHGVPDVWCECACGAVVSADDMPALLQERAAQAARIAELEAQHAGAWQPLGDGDEAACACSEETCETIASVDDGALTLEDADGMVVSFWLGEEYAFYRRVVANAADGASPPAA